MVAGGRNAPFAMRQHRIHLAPLQQGETTLTGSEAKHLARVLRVKAGAKVTAFNGDGLEAEGMVTSVDNARVVLKLEEPAPSSSESSLKITLAVALLKGDKLSQVVRQGTELGVCRFQPFTSQYSDVPMLSKNKLERLRRVAQEAAKQSKRSVIPGVAEAVKLEALELSPLSLVAHPDAPLTLSETVHENVDGLTLITGPEGGLSEVEVERLEARGAKAVHLGERILRAETAPIALIAALLVPKAL